jgi:hypothetical protein
VAPILLSRVKKDPPSVHVLAGRGLAGSIAPEI